MSKQTYTLYLSTVSSSSLMDRTTLVTAGSFANTYWNINWKNIFQGATGKCNIRIQLISYSSANVNLWNNFVGSIRTNFSSPFSFANNGFVIGNIQPITDIFTAGNKALLCDTTNSNGITINIPDDNSPLNIRFLTYGDILMSNIPEFECILYFDIL